MENYFYHAKYFSKAWNFAAIFSISIQEYDNCTRVTCFRKVFLKKNGRIDVFLCS